MNRTVLVLVAVLVSIAQPSFAQSSCETTALTQSLGGGFAGVNGVPTLETTGLPLQNLPLSFRVRNAPPSSTGLLFFSANHNPTVIPAFGTTFHPGAPFFINSFSTDEIGESPPLLNQQVLDSMFCGAEIFLQAVLVDPTLANGLSLSDGLRAVIGGVDVTPPPPGAPVPAAPVLDPHAAITIASSVTLTGVSIGAFDLEVQSPTGLAIVPVAGDVFSVNVFLKPDQINAITLTAISDQGVKSAPTTTSVIHDKQVPEVFVDFPPNGQQITTTTVDVAGRVGDLLSGFMDLTVTVNGIPADVDVGIGTNGTFFAPSVPLNETGSTNFLVIATDALGNVVTDTSVSVSKITATGTTMVVLAGNGQIAPAGTLLPKQLAVLMTNLDGSPLANKVVTFQVTKSDGRVTADPPPAWMTGLELDFGLHRDFRDVIPPKQSGSLSLQAKTGNDGIARAFWVLGSDAGCGNNRITVTSKDVSGSVFFCASGTTGQADRISVGMGNNQRGETGTVLTEPIRVWVSDGQNPVAGISVEFTVTNGAGSVEGATSTIGVSDQTGHAEVLWTLGLAAGANQLEASVPGLPGLPATFNATGLDRDPANPTSFHGIVLDNARRAVGGAPIALTIQGITLGTTTDVNGQFEIADTLLAGPGKLHIDGLTATTLDGLAVPVGSFPNLEFDVVLVANARNSLPMPASLPALNPANTQLYSTTKDTTLTVEGIDGLTMRIQAGSMTLQNGAVAPDGTPVSLNQVHFDEIPMPMPDGAAPPFAWTLQPSGAHFDPPVEISCPNMVGLSPGAVMYFLSFNHDTAQFEIVSAGQVSDDGAMMVSDAGDGISAAGWGGFCPPYPNQTNVEGVVGDSPPSTNPAPPECDPDDGFLACVIPFTKKIKEGCGEGPITSQQDLQDLHDCQAGWGKAAAGILQNAPGTTTSIGSGPPSFKSLFDFLVNDLAKFFSAPAPDATTFSTTIIEVLQKDVTGTSGDVFYDAEVLVTYASPPIGVVDLPGSVSGNLAQFGLGPNAVAVVEFLSVGANSMQARMYVFDFAAFPIGTAVVGGQVSVVNEDGSFSIPNVPAPAGTVLRPSVLYEGGGEKLLSAPDNYLLGAIGGVTDFGSFELLPAPTFPDSIALTFPNTVITQALTVMQGTVLGQMDNGSVQDLTLQSRGTTYTSSSPAIVDVDSNGGITALGSGTAFITASNEGVSSTAGVVVSLGDPLTTVEGFVHLEDGTPFEGADVTLSLTGTITQTDATGFFQFEMVPSFLGDFIVSARATVGMDELSGATFGVQPVEGGVTDAGIIVLREAVYWVSMASGQWGDANNWSTGSVPQASDTVIIAPGAPTPVTVTVSAGTFAADSVQCDDNLVIQSGTLQVAGLSNIVGTISVNTGGVLEGGVLLLGSNSTLGGGTLRSLTAASSVLSTGIVVTADSTLDGVVMDANLSITPESGNSSSKVLTILSGLTLNGTATLTGNFLDRNSVMEFPGIQTLTGTGTVFLNANHSNNGMAFLYSDVGGALTIDADILVRGRGFIGRTGSTLVNLGTIRADVSGGQLDVRGNPITNLGTIEALAGAILEIDGPDMMSSGTLSTSGGVLVLDGTWVNTGAIVANGGTLTLKGSWGMQGLGSITTTNTTVNMEGSYTLGNVTTLAISGGTVNLKGVLDNQGGDLDLAPSSAVWNLAGGTIETGRVLGGSLTVTADSTLDGVVMDANLSITPESGNSSSKVLTILSGLTLNGTATLTGNFLDRNSVMEFPGIQTLTGTGTVFLNANHSNNGMAFLYSDVGGALTIDADILVRGRGFIGRTGSTLVNLGTIRADVSGGQLDVRGQNWTSSGILEASTASTLRCNNSWSTSGDVLLAGGTISTTSPFDLEAGGTLQGSGTVQGDLLNGGTVRPGSSTGTIAVTGDYTQSSTGTLEIELGGTTPGVDHDLLAVQGGVILDGTLVVILEPGYQPQSGDMYDVLTYPNLISGSFSTENLADPGPGLMMSALLQSTELRLAVTPSP